MRLTMKPPFPSLVSTAHIVRVVNDAEVSVGTVSREETMMHTPEQPSYRYIVEVLGKYQGRFGGIDHVVGFLQGVSAVLTDVALNQKPVRK